MLKRLVIIGFLLSVRMFAQTTISNVYVQSSTATTTLESIQVYNMAGQ